MRPMLTAGAAEVAMQHEGPRRASAVASWQCSLLRQWNTQRLYRADVRRIPRQQKIFAVAHPVRL